MRGRRLPGGLWALFLGKAPCRFGASKRSVADADAARAWTDGACCTNDSADRELAAADHFAHEAIAQRMVPGSVLLRHGARRGHADRGHRPKHGVGIDRRRAAKRR